MPKQLSLGVLLIGSLMPIMSLSSSLNQRRHTTFPSLGAHYIIQRGEGGVRELFEERRTPTPLLVSPLQEYTPSRNSSFWGRSGVSPEQLTPMPLPSPSQAQIGNNRKKPHLLAIYQHGSTLPLLIAVTKKTTIQQALENNESLLKDIGMYTPDQPCTIYSKHGHILDPEMNALAVRTIKIK